MAPESTALEGTERVLVVRLGAVGDVIRTLPATHLLKSSFPRLHLAWIVEDLSSDLLEGNPEIDEVIRFPRRALKSDRAHPRRLAARLAALRSDLASRRFDLAIDFQGSFKSGVITLLSGARRRIGLGPGHARELSFLCTSEWVRPRSRWLNRVERNLLLAEAIGAAGDAIEVMIPENPEEAGRAREILREASPDGDPVVVLAPGTSSLQSHKRWPAAHFSLLAGLLRKSPGVRSLVAWGPGEESLAQAVVSASNGAARALPPVGLRLLASILRRSSLFVGADTGPMHLAWGVGCPVVAIFGTTDPRLNAPLGKAHAVLRGIGSPAAIEPEKVADSAGRILEREPFPRLLAARSILSRREIFPRSSGEAS
jgi:lipopolysaccharide heptosyltransferase I